MVHTLYNFSRLVIVILSIIGLFGFLMMFQGKYGVYYDYADIKARVDECNNNQYEINNLSLGQNIDLNHLSQYGKFYVRVNNVSEVIRPEAEVLSEGIGNSITNFSGCSIEIKDVVLSLYTNVDGKEIFLQRSYIEKMGFRSDTQPLPKERQYDMNDILLKVIDNYKIDNFGEIRVLSLQNSSERKEKYEFYEFDVRSFEDNLFASRDKGSTWLKVVYPYRNYYFDELLGLRKFEDLVVDGNIKKGSAEEIELEILRTYVSETGEKMGINSANVCFRPKLQKGKVSFLSEKETFFSFYGICEEELPDL